MSRIQLRRDTAADWTAANPVLAPGELGVELDTGLLKFGDGSTAWSGLAYLAAPATGVSSVDGGTGTIDLTGKYAQRGNNLDDLADLDAARTNLGVAQTTTFEQHGAVGDGNADDTAAMAAACAAVSAAGGGVVYGTVGRTYLGTLAVPSNVHVDLRGAQIVVPDAASAGVTCSLVAGTQTARGGLRRGTIVGNASTVRGMKLLAPQLFRLVELRIKGFTNAAAIAVEVTSWNDGGTWRYPVDCSWRDVEITDSPNGMLLTKDSAGGDPATFGANFQRLDGVRISGYSGIGFNLDWGEGLMATALRCTTGNNNTTGIRVNDQVATFIGCTADNSYNSGGESNIGWDLTASAYSTLILNPLGNLGSLPGNTRIRDNGLYTQVLRQSFSELPGDYLRSTVAGASGAWKRAATVGGASAVSAGEVVTVVGAADGSVLRSASASSPVAGVHVATDGASPGALCYVALPGSVVSVNCDTGAVAAGDTLVSSTVSNAKAMSSNTTTDPRKIIGEALSSKTAGANGTVLVCIR